MITTASDALAWMEGQRRGRTGAVLFRGQSRVWPTIRPSMVRDDDETSIAMWNICRQFSTSAAGVTGYSIPAEHDRLAILQHYIGRSPVIDLTATPLIAIYFALQGAEPGHECIVYAIDRAKCENTQAVFSDHSFLALPLESGGLRHRWLRQDGYSVCPAGWPAYTAVQQFDFLELRGVDFRRFTKAPGDDSLVSGLADLEDVSYDPLASAVRAAVTLIARSLDMFTPRIAQILASSRTLNPEAQLTGEIDALITTASGLDGARDLLITLRDLRAAVGKWWDMSYDCSLENARAQLNRLQQR